MGIVTARMMVAWVFKQQYEDTYDYLELEELKEFYGFANFDCGLRQSPRMSRFARHPQL